MPIPYGVWETAQKERGVDLSAVRAGLKAFKIELPSWGFGNSGTRFRVFPYPGAAGTLWEKLDDAAMVNRLTGICPTVAIHIPWDKVDDYGPVKDYAAERGVAIGAVTPNLFQDAEYKFGSLTNSDPAVRRKAVNHMLTAWTSAPDRQLHVVAVAGRRQQLSGQGDIRARKTGFGRASRGGRRHDDGARMLIEYKMFEPPSTHRLADWAWPTTSPASWATRAGCW